MGSSYRLIPASEAPPGAPGGLAGTAGSSAQVAGTAAATSQLPGYMTSMQNIGTNIASETAGEVPEDVIAQLKQHGAEQNVSTGAASNAAYLHALGLTSLGLKQTGQQNLESILHSTPGYDVSQNPSFQTSSNLAYEQQLQPEIFSRQDAQQQFALQQQEAAMKAAYAGWNTGVGANQWSSGPQLSPSAGRDMLGFPNTPGGGGGYGSAGIDSGGGWTSMANPPAVGGYNFDTSNQPGSAGAYNAWNAWNAEGTTPDDTGAWDYANEAVPQDYYE